MTNPLALDRDLRLSLLIHAGLSLPFVALWILPSSPVSEAVSITVIENPSVSASAKVLELRAPARPRVPAPPQSAPKVFGLSQKALTTEGSATAPEIKAGNTLATPQDDAKLDPNSEDLPIPTDEFLVSAMPKLVEGVQVPYPESARRSGLQGSVRAKILIDETGRVRRVDVLESPSEDMSRAATEALSRFRFQPARVEDRAVAVVVTYTYTFRLQQD